MIRFNITIPTFYYLEGIKNIYNSVKKNNQNTQFYIFDNTKNNLIYNFYYTKIRTNNKNFFYYKNLPTVKVSKNWNNGILFLEKQKDKHQNYLIKNYFITLHQDEYLCNNFFKILEKIILKENYPDVISYDTLVIYKYKILNKIHTTSSQRYFFFKFNFNYILKRNFIGPTASLAIKLTKRNNLFNGNYKWLIDVEYYLKLYQKTKRWVFTDSIFVLSDSRNNFSLTKLFSEKISLLYLKEIFLITKNKSFKNLILFKIFDLYIWSFIRLFNKLKLFFSYKKYYS
jgi:hypothetical protein